MRHHLLAALLGLVGITTSVQASVLPPNEMHLEDHLYEANPNIDEVEFNQLIQRARDLYGSAIKKFGAELEIRALWTNSTVNASAHQSSGKWVVSMYGGLARRPEVTPDGFVMVLCHELGHHLAGFPFAVGWAANEGQSDYFASQECAKKFWGQDYTSNASVRREVNFAAKRKCDEVWYTTSDQDLCYRTMLAAKSISDLLASSGSSQVDFSTPDRTRVEKTYGGHPDAQCRLDTYTAGALCTTDFDEDIIPGKGFSNRSSLEAEREASYYSCTSTSQHVLGLRPRCWYKPRL